MSKLLPKHIFCPIPAILLGATSIFLCEGLMVNRYAQAGVDEGPSARATEALEQYIEGREKKQELKAELIELCDSMRGMRAKATAIADKNRTTNLKNYNDALYLIKRIDRKMDASCF